VKAEKHAIFDSVHATLLCDACSYHAAGCPS
jgi:hypothetical protein